jgi:cell division protein FtsQ
MLLTQRHIDIRQQQLGKLDIYKMEHILTANPWIEDVQVYVSNDRQLHVSVTQRIPQLRVFERNGNSYYLDSSQHILPLSDNYTHYALLFLNVPELKDDSMSTVLKSKMLYLTHAIRGNSFWNAQLSQININNGMEFELIPVLGNQKILLGDTDRLQEKLNGLFAFYRNVLNKIGWDKYEVLDLRFKDQVIASPSLPWKAPVDRALTNMNWVKTIIGNAPPQTLASAFPMTSADQLQQVVAAQPAAVTPKPAPPKPQPAAAKPPKPNAPKPAAANKPAKR